jgi:antirestriction protein ArdC
MTKSTFKPTFDVKQHVTDQLIEMLEAGQGSLSAMWSKSQFGMPTNALTGVQYTGSNVFLLSFSAAVKEYPSNRWMTYKQAQSVGAQVRKGEKSTTCIYFTVAQTKSSAAQAGAGAGEAGREFYPMCKGFYLFNVAQIDNIPAEFATAEKPLLGQFEINQAAQALMTSTGANIEHGGENARYIRGRDLIQLPPPECFTTEANYYAVGLHELGHWTGHESRLNREFGKKYGDAAYAFEELVAEMTSAFLMAELGLFNATVENHAGYLQAWLKILKADKCAIFTASKQASLAYSYILGRSAAPTACSNHEQQATNIEEEATA